MLVAVYLNELDGEATMQVVRGLIHQNNGLHSHLPRVVVLVKSMEQDGQEALNRVKQEFDSTVLLSLTSEREFDLSFHQLCEAIVKALSNRAFGLNDFVSQQKKGLTNTFRSFFSSSPAPPAPNKNGQDSPAYKTRSLADLLFMLRDYDGALQTYAHLRDDYSKDASELIKLGSALEMMARCLLVLKQQPEKRCEALERSIDCFVKSAASSVPVNAAPNAAAKRQIPLAYRLATNATVLLLEATVTGASFAKTNLRLLRRVMSVESEICCAVLLEQAALITQQQLKMRRKACFDVLRAGSLFRTLGLNSHAFRCYQQIYREDIQRGSAWFAAEHHLQLNLGYLARNLRDGRQLVDLRGALLERGLQIEINPASLHISLLKEYLDAIAPHQIVRHQIPKLEPRATALVSQAFAQERAVFAVMATNPLACAIVLTEMQIIGNEGGDIEHNVLPMYVCEPLHVTLQPKETQLLEVGFTPQREGEITIKGIQWKLGEHHGSFQHLVLPPVLTKVLPKQACLEATVLAFPNGKFQVEMKNVGALDLPAGELLVMCNDPGSILLGPQHNLAATSETSVTLNNPELKMGETFTLQSRLFNQVDECIVQYGEGKRTLRIQLPLVPKFESPLVKANVVFTCGKRLLVVDVSSKFPICPTGLAMFTSHNKCSVNPITREFVGKQCFANTWQLAFDLGEEDECNVVQLVPDAMVKTERLSPQDDFRFRFHHLKAVASEVSLAKQRIEQLRQEMEAKGQLPVSIQDVRRARQNNAAIFQAAGLGKLQHPAGSIEAILDDGSSNGEEGEGGRFVHVALDWCALESTGLLPNKSYCCRIPLGRQGLTLSLLPLLTNELYLPSDKDMCELAVTLQIQNLGQSVLENVELEIGGDERVLRGSFPRPDFYLGPTKRVWPKLAPGESSNVTVTAVFTGAGVFLLGPALARSSTASASLEGERFVVVRRRQLQQQCMEEGAKPNPPTTTTTAAAAGEDVFAQVQQALQDDDDDSLA
ncbi:hypothetical protein BASA81_009107 [Batrachochytrium salamandrivorans]|nr:hypothetical protein BASA81_009107 [Batrachochytrium salamandrivorans]